MNEELPEGWEWSTIGEVADVQLGRQRSPQHHQGEQMRPYLRSANVTWDGISLDDVKEMNFDDTDFERYLLEPGDLLVNEASGSPNEVGKPAIWSGELDGCCFQNTLLRLRPHSIDRSYLYWFCYFSALTGRFGEAGRGVNIRHVGKRGLSQFRIPLPPRSDQGGVVAAIEEHLSLLNDATMSLSGALDSLKLLWDGTLREAFDEPMATAPAGDLAEVRGGIQKQPKRKPRSNTAPFLRVANVMRGTLLLDEVHEVELFDGELDRYRLADGDLLVVEGNGSPQQIGRAARWRDEIPGCVHQNHLIRVRPGPDLDPEFLDLYWNAPSTALVLREVASSTSGLYTLSTSKVKAVPVPVISLEEQRAIVRRLRPLETIVQRVSAEVAKQFVRSDSLRRSILAAAFSGRLTVEELAA